jgi:hypothetical protein
MAENPYLPADDSLLTVADTADDSDRQRWADRQRQRSVKLLVFNEQPFLLTMLTVLTIYSDLFLPALISKARLEATL